MDQKPVYITATPYNQKALAAIAKVSAATGMNRSQAAVYLVMKGAGILKTGAALDLAPAAGHE